MEYLSAPEEAVPPVPPVGYTFPMDAMLLEQPGHAGKGLFPLRFGTMPEPAPGPGQVLVRVGACAVCHTEIDEIEGRTPPPRYPVVPGHQAVGRVAAAGPGTRRFSLGERVAVGWINGACGTCPACRSGRENLCPDFRATGRDADGGYAEYLCVDENFAFPVPASLGDAEAAPLLCAGAVGYRALALAGFSSPGGARGRTLGLAGFGASAHLVIQAARALNPGLPVFVFARGEKARALARELGADWTGTFGEEPPERPDAIIDTTPAWKPVLDSLAILAPGGELVINAIGKEDADRPLLAGLDYRRHLWMEKRLKTVANVTRADIAGFLDLAATAGIRPRYTEYPLSEANEVLAELRAGGGSGARVLVP